jgi:putative ABC transport system permease protein
MGLYLGFGRMVTMMIDHVDADLWVVSRGTKSFEDLSLLGMEVQRKVMAIGGVAKVTPLVVGFSAWRVPGSMTPVFVIGLDLKDAALQPWSVVEGTIQALAAVDAVVVDRSYYERLGVSGLGATAELHGHKVRVAAVTDGIRSFTTTPYVFSQLARARTYLGLPSNKANHLLIRLAPGSDAGLIRGKIEASVPDLDVLTPDDLRARARDFWLFGTGAGAALFAGALLGVIVGTVIVAQTLYSNTKEHLAEFATLRAIGCSNRYIFTVIRYQALLNAIIGFAIAAMIAFFVVQWTAKSALPIVITPELALGLFALTIFMCMTSALVAVVRVVRIDPVMVLTQ